MLAKEYNHEEVEKKWREKWNDSLYYFEKSSEKIPYIIDTPPPYPTGDFHIGNALNWCYIDFIARYKKMRGCNVMFPQGWDCHGLPTEVKVEEKYGMKKMQLSRSKFRKLCKELTMENIEKMKEIMRRLGMSIDWSKEYITEDDSYKKYTQTSFVKMYKKGMIYREEHPVSWCPRCETAIAYAEVEYEDRDAHLNYILFERENKNMSVEIATTRPELLASCVAVAVHPSDGRYEEMVGEKLKVPLFGHKVKIYEDESVDPDFGTGVVMICTFGDKQDVKWWKKHNLPLRMSIDDRGRMTGIVEEYEGLSVTECKEKIIEDLKEKGLLRRRERLKQNVGVCWRCKTLIEIISTRQWFVKVNKEEIRKAAKRIKWYPAHFFTRLENWVSSIEWDWCISRQRIFGVPIPVWYCKKCGAVKVAEEEKLPIDPLQEKPKKACDNCGSYEFKGEKDVLDTWMDSSLTALWVNGYDFNADSGSEKKFIPTELRPQGHDIIRTWAFYTILRTLSLANEIPWHTIMINGMVLGEDGYKMSKSRDNIVSPEEVINKYGADAFRQWAAIGGSVGSDVQFRWKDIVSARRFMQKLWSILRFSLVHLSSYEPKRGELKLRSVDKWLLSKLNELIAAVRETMDNFKFDEAIKNIRTFAWDILADNYIELVKGRLYGKNGEEGKEAAKYALYEAVKNLSILLSPFTPFLSEEMYSHITKGKGENSVHAEKMPEVKEEFADIDAVEKGELISSIVSAVRRYKSERGMPLSTPLWKIKIWSDRIKDIDKEAEDIENAAVTKVELCKDGIKSEDVSVTDSEIDILDVAGTNTKVGIIKQRKNKEESEKV